MVSPVRNRLVSMFAAIGFPGSIHPPGIELAPRTPETANSVAPMTYKLGGEVPTDGAALCVEFNGYRAAVRKGGLFAPYRDNSAAVARSCDNPMAIARITTP